MADGDITGLSLRGVRKLIDDKSIGESVLDAVDGLLGAVIVLSPLVAGPAALPLLALVEPKNELVKITKGAIKTMAKSQASDYLDKATRMAAANCLLTFTAYFDVLSQSLPGLTKEIRLTEEEKRRIAAAAVEPATSGMSEVPPLGQRENAVSFQAGELANLVISVPHPAALDEARDTRLELYEGMSKSILRMLSGLDAWEHKPIIERTQMELVLSEQIPALACSVYEAEYLGMAVDFPQFFVWSVLRDQQEKDALIKTVGADLRTQFELIAFALQTVDLGLQHLATAIRQIPRPAAIRPLPPDLAAVAEALYRNHEDEIDEPIIDDRYDVDDGRPRLVYPKKVDSYVPQAYRLARYLNETTHLEREEEWTARPVHSDLGPFLMRHLESPYSVETPLLILGHPGSGKSLLTQVIAARLAYPQYTTVRVELRDVNPDTDIQAQIEAQIRKNTGRDINWADWVDHLAMNPPIVILDGYDELLQATGKLFADYLDQVRRFQHREAVQHRPVRVIVTSRLTLIDKAIVPPGATIVRLEEFDDERREAWTAVWNAHNSGYFQQARIRPFKLPTNDKIIQLAEQPLLLLMLALYDSNGNKLSSQPNIDQTLLYEQLLARFIERERSKGAGGAEFTGLPEADRKAEIDQEMEHLGVAAIGMFNRQDVKIRRDELNADLRYFEAEQDRVADGTRRMSQADLLLGSFFFIHESRSRVADDSAEALKGSAAFEFLHNTFGEFLAADFILRKVIAEANTICALSGEAALGDTLRQRLAIVSQGWFACLINTPLHTRPNILAMLREWGGHRLSHGPRPPADLLKSLDMIIVAQLRSLLTQTSISDLFPKRAGSGETPYSPSPVLGHLAIYSLNLVLLRCFLTEGTYVLEEADLGTQPGGCRPWDRLVSIWRSWFPLESLGALAMLFTATRHETRIEIESVRSSLTVPNSSNLYTAYNVSVALADDLAAASTGIHVASLIEISESFLQDLRARIQPEVPGLIPIVDSMLPRMFGGGITNQPAFFGEAPVERLLSGKHPKVPGYMLNFTEMVNRLVITPRQRARMSVDPSELSQLTFLSRYEAELTVHTRNELESRWLPFLLRSRSPEIRREDTDLRPVWRRFLLSPAAAPTLRAAWRCLDKVQCAEIVADVADALADSEVRAFDIDTVAALAVLSWRGGAVELCARSLETIIQKCSGETWNMLDVPIETWGGLADLFVSGDPVIESQRNRFAALIHLAINVTFGIYRREPELVNRAFSEFWIHAFRIIGAPLPEYAMDIVQNVLSGPMNSLGSTADRSSILLLMRWARENHDHEFVLRVFGVPSGPDREWLTIFGEGQHGRLAEIDIDKASMELTYREVMDLRWVVNILRQEPRKRTGVRAIKPAPSGTRRRKR